MLQTRQLCTMMVSLFGNYDRSNFLSVMMPQDRENWNVYAETRPPDAS